MKAQLKNWQTTLCGALLAGLMVLAEKQQGSDLTDWKEWLVPGAIATTSHTLAMTFAGSGDFVTVTAVGKTS